MRALRLVFRLHEFGGQPVEQFGMRRPFALRAEIVEHLRKSRAEELAPEAVHGDARGQRILRTHQPVARSSRVARRPPVSSLPRKPGTARLHDLAGIVHPVAARQNARLGGRDRLGDHHARDGAVEHRRSLLALRHVRASDCASGAAHWKCAATAAFCASVRLSSAMRSACSTSVRNLLAFFGRGPRIRSGKRQAEAADGGAAKFGILPECAPSARYPRRSRAAGRSAAPDRPWWFRYTR